LKLLDEYPIVTGDHLGAVPMRPADEYTKLTAFGWATQAFSDQCYFSTTKFMKAIDYDTTHPIAQEYPAHGGNSFERRVAQYLANNNLWVAALEGYHYQHIDRGDK